MQRDEKVFQMIDRERKRQERGLELIASENLVTRQVMEAMGSCLTNKYAEGLPGKRYYGGCQHVDEVENLARDRACELFGAEWANVQPHSGAQANAAVMLALINPGDTIMGIDLAHGGHLTHGAPVNFSGKIYNPVFYGVDQDTGLIDYDDMEKKAREHKPKLLICGGSAYARDWDYERFRKVADETGAILMADIAHPAGIIAKGFLKNPLKHCDVVTTTTHKTLRGPRGGMIMLGKDFPNPVGVKTKSGKTKRMSTILDSAVFPGMQGGPLEHVIAGKAIAFGEALTDDFKNYVEQVVKNAKVVAEAFQNKGYKVITGGTDNHLNLIDLRTKGHTGKEAEESLEKAGITLNKNMVPYDDQPPLITSGVRVGTAAVTSRGMKEDDMKQIVDFIDDGLNNKTDDQYLEKLGKKVEDFCSSYSIYPEDAL